MKTKVVTIQEENLEQPLAQQALEEAGEILKKGGLVAFPTETVYGLGGDALQPESSKKIYAAKGRPSDNPLIVHIYRTEDMERIARDIPKEAYELADAFWPGPLTMIMNRADVVPTETTGGMDTVAIRMPSNRIAAELIRYGGGFIAAPSANTSGRPSPTLARYCIEDLDGKIEMIIDGGQVGIGLESTIVDMTVNPPMILRPGYITKEMLEKVIGRVEVDRTILDANSKEKPKAPGMKYRHYAPKGDLSIIEGAEDAVIGYINAETERLMKEGKRVGVICTDKTKSAYHGQVIKSAGNRDNEETIAKELFRILREFDDEDVDVMFSESFEAPGIGQAIMNRLLKAAGQHVIHV